MSKQVTEEKKGQVAPNASDDQKPIPNSKVEEKFDNLDLTDIGKDELALYGNCKWTIWENIEMVSEKIDKRAGKDENWADKMRKVAWFDNMI